MDATTARRRAAEARVGHLATVTPAARPHVVPCCFALVGGPAEGDADHHGTVYTAIDAKPKSTLALRRAANLARNPAATLLVDHYAEDWSTLWWIRLDGSGRVVDGGPERDRGLQVLAAKYEQYRETVPPGPVIAVDVTGWRAWP